MIVAYHSDAPGNVFYNNEAVKLTLTLAGKDAAHPLAIQGGAWRIKEIEDQEGWPYHPDRGVNSRILESDAVLGAGQVAPQIGPAGSLDDPVAAHPPGAPSAFTSNWTTARAQTRQFVWGFVVGYPPARAASRTRPSFSAS